MIKDKQRSDLIKYRIEQAKATKNEAKLMIDNGYQLKTGQLGLCFYFKCLI